MSPLFGACSERMTSVVVLRISRGSHRKSMLHCHIQHAAYMPWLRVPAAVPYCRAHPSGLAPWPPLHPNSPGRQCGVAYKCWRCCVPPPLQFSSRLWSSVLVCWWSTPLGGFLTALLYAPLCVWGWIVSLDALHALFRQVVAGYPQGATTGHTYPCPCIEQDLDVLQAAAWWFPAGRTCSGVDPLRHAEREACV